MPFEVWVRSDGKCLQPAGADAVATMSEMPRDKVFRARIVVDRNHARTRFYFALCQRVAELLEASGDDMATKDLIDQRIRVAVGLYRLVPLSGPQAKATGQRYAVITQSIKMDEPAFSRFLDNVTGFIRVELLPHMTLRQFRDEIREIEKMVSPEQYR